MVLAQIIDGETIMKKLIKQAFIATIPVLTGYLVLGFGFGIVLKSAGYGVMLAFIMSFFIYAGSMQYVAVGLLTGGASLLTAALTTLMVNARHLFYGISMLGKYQNAGKRKAYLILALTDETYSLLCGDIPNVPRESERDYSLLVSLLNHTYWVTGSVLGAFVGSILKFNTEGVDFALTALFLTVFIEQWMLSKNHIPAIVGAGASVLCLVLFGADKFLIPAMLLILLALCLYKEDGKND